MRTVVSVMPDNPPIKKNIFHLGATPDVMHDHVGSVLPSLVHNDPNVSNPASQVPSNNVSG